MTQLKDNMSNIEKIRQEIERRIENYWSDGDVDSVAISGELEELIDFIDSLPEEKPSEDLEEAAEKYADGEMMSGLAERAFIAGAEWQRKQDATRRK